MKQTFPEVSVIILNWNAKDYLKRCLNSVLETSYQNFRIIVVDNGSNDGSQEMVKKFYPQVKLVENKSNLGFAEGNNVGIRMVHSEYIILLNNDTTVDKNWITELVNVAMTDDNIGVLGCKVYFSGTNVLQHAGGYVNSGNSLFSHIGVFEEDHSQFNDVRDVDYVSGVALMFKKEMIPEVGLLDPDYFAYWEDTDFCYRVKKAGYRIIYVPGAAVEHAVSASWRTLPFRAKILYQRNRVRFVIKNYRRQMILKWIVTEPLYIYKHVNEGLLRMVEKRSGLLKGLNSDFAKSRLDFLPKGIIEWGVALVCAYFWNLAFLPRTVKRRLEEKSLRMCTS